MGLYARLKLKIFGNTKVVPATAVASKTRAPIELTIDNKSSSNEVKATPTTRTRSIRPTPRATGTLTPKDSSASGEAKSVITVSDVVPESTILTSLKGLGLITSIEEEEVFDGDSIHFEHAIKSEHLIKQIGNYLAAVGERNQSEPDEEAFACFVDNAEHKQAITLVLQQTYDQTNNAKDKDDVSVKNLLDMLILMLRVCPQSQLKTGYLNVLALTCLEMVRSSGNECTLSLSENLQKSMKDLKLIAGEQLQERTQISATDYRNFLTRLKYPQLSLQKLGLFTASDAGEEPRLRVTPRFARR